MAGTQRKPVIKSARRPDVRSEILDRLLPKMQRGARILEFGPGKPYVERGYFTDLMAKKYPHLRFMTLDIAQQPRTVENIQRVQGDILRAHKIIPYKVDLVHEHAVSPLFFAERRGNEYLNVLNRVLRKRGYAVSPMMPTVLEYKNLRGQRVRVSIEEVLRKKGFMITEKGRAVLIPGVGKTAQMLVLTKTGFAWKRYRDLGLPTEMTHAAPPQPKPKPWWKFWG